MRTTDYFYYMDLLDKCGFYKEADDVYSLVRTAQRSDIDDTILPGVFKNNGNKVPQKYNIYGRPNGMTSLPRNMNQGRGLDGTTVLPFGNNIPLGLNGETVLPSTSYKFDADQTVLPSINPFRDDPDRTILPGDPNAHLFKKLELIHQEFEAVDNRKTANGAPAYNLNPRLFKQLAKKYFLPEILINSLLADEGRVNQVAQNKSAFFAKASQIEQLAEQNPKAWNKFINSNFATRMISNKVYNVFKNIGTGSKSLSQSMKGLNMQSPYWALIGPALEFGLYQFGLYLENPNGYNLGTPEQSTLTQLNTKITEILADNKIADKKGYFMKNYGSTLKTLGTMEQNELLGKFPVMPFNSFMGIGQNIGQK